MAKSSHKTLSDIYLVLGYIILVQESIIPNLDFLRLFFSFSFLGISIFYWIFANFKYKLPGFFKATNLLMLLFTISGLALWFSGEALYIQNSGYRVSNATFIISCYSSILPMFAFYSFAMEGVYKPAKIERIVKVLFWIAIFNYFIARVIYSNTPNHVNMDEFTNNASYACVALLPLLLVLKNKPRIFYLYLSILIILIVISMKRGAILIAAILTMLLFFYSLDKKSKNGRLVNILIIISLLVVGYLGFSLYISGNSFAQERIELTKEGYTSGRDLLYEQIFFHLSTVDKEQLIWGGGAWHTLNIASNYAHSDWLEIAVDQGLVGVAIYLLFWISLLVSIHKIRQDELSHRIVLMFFILYFSKSIMSMSYSDLGLVAGLGIGYFIGIANKHTSNTRMA